MWILPVSRPRPSVLGALVSATLIAGACRGSEAGSAGAEPGGTVVITTGGEPDFLLPPLVASLGAKQVVDQIFERLAHLGPELVTVGDKGFAPGLASRWTWARDSLSIAFHLDPRARWHDGRPVRASDVKFSHRLYTDPRLGSRDAALLANIDSVSAPDSLTAVVWFRERRPEQFFDVAYQLSIMPEHVLAEIDPTQLRAHPAARNPVGSGPFRFVRWDAGSRLEIVADTTHFRGRPPLDRVIWSFAPDAQTTVTRLLAGDADFHESIPAPMMADVSRNPNITLVQYPSRSYGYLGFNLKDGAAQRPHPILADRQLRRALTMSVDRQALIRNVFDTLARVPQGPFVSALGPPEGSVKQIPFDVERATRLLDSLGWRDTNGDGIREKNGRPLEFGILVPTSSRPRMNIAVLLQEQFRRVGAKANIEALEFTTFLDRLRRRRFDAFVGTWVLEPSPGGIRQTWTTAGIAGDDASNFGSYSNPAFDALVDSALLAHTAEQRRDRFRRAYQVIVDDAPAVWLFEPRMVAGMHRRLQVPELRADGWWLGLSQWWIPADQRIARDSIGLRLRAE